MAEPLPITLGILVRDVDRALQLADPFGTHEFDGGREALARIEEAVRGGRIHALRLELRQDPETRDAVFDALDVVQRGPDAFSGRTFDEGYVERLRRAADVLRRHQPATAPVGLFGFGPRGEAAGEVVDVTDPHDDEAIPSTSIDPEEVPLPPAQDGSEAERTADTKADTPKSLGLVSLPKDGLLLDLIHELKRRVPNGETCIAIARKIAGKNKADADSLMRQARRYRHLWDPKHKPRG